MGKGCHGQGRGPEDLRPSPPAEPYPRMSMCRGKPAGSPRGPRGRQARRGSSSGCHQRSRSCKGRGHREAGRAGRSEVPRQGGVAREEGRGPLAEGRGNWKGGAGKDGVRAKDGAGCGGGGLSAVQRGRGLGRGGADPGGSRAERSRGELVSRAGPAVEGVSGGSWTRPAFTCGSSWLRGGRGPQSRHSSKPGSSVRVSSRCGT